MTLEDLVTVARTSQFYRRLYQRLGPNPFPTPWSLEALPIASFDDVTEAVHDDPRALCTQGAHGLCFTTSGTTGRPKSVFFGHEEFQLVHRKLAEAHARTGAIRDGDVICSISEPGSASFMAIHHVAGSFPGRCSEIPIGCDVGYPAVIRAAEQFGATVFAGMNGTILGLAELLLRLGKSLPQARMLLGGGELFYGAQLDLVRRAFPNADYASFLYGALEAGLIGFGAPGLPHNEVRILDELCLVELYDPDTGLVIKEADKLGRVLVTNFARDVAPAIRLETGDIGKWRDPPSSRQPRLSLHGRAFPFALALDGIRICEDDVWGIIEKYSCTVPLLKLQLVLGDTNKVLVALDGAQPTTDQITRLKELFRAIGLEVDVEIVALSYFEDASRRKGRLIVDRRNGEIHCDE